MIYEIQIYHRINKSYFMRPEHLKTYHVETEDIQKAINYAYELCNESYLPGELFIRQDLDKNIFWLEYEKDGKRSPVFKFLIEEYVAPVIVNLDKEAVS